MNQGGVVEHPLVEEKFWEKIENGKNVNQVNLLCQAQEAGK